MTSFTRRMSLLALTITLVGGCLEVGGGSAEGALVEGEDVRVEGRVTEIDKTPMFVDGDGRIYVDSDAHGAVVVRVPARERLCQAEGLDVLSSLAAGDRMRASGKVTGSREVTVCAEETHFLTKLE